MRTLLFSMVLGGLVLSSCSESPGEFDVAHISGPGWTVASFTDDDDDLYTSLFVGHVFDFQENGALLVTVSDSLQFQGFYDFTEENTRIRLDVSGTDGLEELRESWEIMGSTPTDFELREVGDNERIRFVK